LQASSGSSESRAPPSTPPTTLLLIHGLSTEPSELSHVLLASLVPAPPPFELGVGLNTALPWVLAASACHPAASLLLLTFARPPRLSFPAPLVRVELSLGTFPLPPPCARCHLQPRYAAAAVADRLLGTRLALTPLPPPTRGACFSMRPSEGPFSSATKLLWALV
jgi:hypothetical protein